MKNNLYIYTLIDFKYNNSLLKKVELLIKIIDKSKNWSLILKSVHSKSFFVTIELNTHKSILQNQINACLSINFCERQSWFRDIKLILTLILSLE